MTLSRRTTLALATTAPALAVPASAAEADLWSGNYWAVKWREDKKIWLAMYRKRLGAPQPGEAAYRVIVSDAYGFHNTDAPRRGSAPGQ